MCQILISRIPSEPAYDNPRRLTIGQLSHKNQRGKQMPRKQTSKDKTLHKDKTRYKQKELQSSQAKITTHKFKNAVNNSQDNTNPLEFKHYWCRLQEFQYS